MKIIILLVGVCIGFIIGFQIHKHEYGEISDKEYFNKLQKKKGE